MQIFVRTISAIAAACALAATSNAGAEITTPAPYAVIMDYETGAILFEKDADTPVGPSSMSKLMTVAIVFEKLKSGELNLTDEFSVSEKAWREKQGSSMWVRVDTKIPLIDLLRGIIVQSGNDACIVIAENVSGTEEAFADLMTKKAREWGLKNSKFVNSTGLPNENQKMSTRDLAILGAGLVHAEGQRRRRRFVDDALHFQAGDAPGVLGGLPLAVVEVGRHGDDGFRHRVAEIILGGLLHLHQYAR